MWRLFTTVEVQARGDRFFFTFTNDRDVNQVKKGGPWVYQSAIILLNDCNEFSDIMAIPLDFGVYLGGDPRSLGSPYDDGDDEFGRGGHRIYQGRLICPRA
ncbi:hypothetical protein ACLB2K_055855 [Fragaria x ananassa]